MKEILLTEKEMLFLLVLYSMKKQTGPLLKMIESYCTPL